MKSWRNWSGNTKNVIIHGLSACSSNKLQENLLLCAMNAQIYLELGEHFIIPNDILKIIDEVSITKILFVNKEDKL